MKNVVLFDFDMTLGFRSPMWTETVRLLLLRRNVFADDDAIVPITHGDVYPWKFRGKARDDFMRGKTWWQAVGGAIADKLVAAGICSREIADGVARNLPDVFCDARYWELFPDTISVLDALKRGGRTLVLLSNHVPEARKIMDSLGVLAFFDKVVISSEQGCEKPDPEIWDIALDGVDRSRAVMVGDNYATDILGAKACGIEGILVRKPNEHGYPLYSRTLEGILPVIEQL